mmetsp:Transcript_17273/g.60345  ORF Transcript_17273/g.60345 Transcript_17273/m.60345 type:complete len:177 (-) Transcript_17273:1112-1642(-)
MDSGATDGATGLMGCITVEATGGSGGVEAVGDTDEGAALAAELWPPPPLPPLPPAPALLAATRAPAAPATTAAARKPQPPLLEALLLEDAQEDVGARVEPMSTEDVGGGPALVSTEGAREGPETKDSWADAALNAPLMALAELKREPNVATAWSTVAPNSCCPALLPINTASMFLS